MSEEIVKCLTDELNYSPGDAEYYAKQIAEYDDIANEFLAWRINRNYDYSPALEIDGWTAKKIYERNRNIDAVTVFMTMYWLRVNPDYVKSELETGFAVK